MMIMNNGQRIIECAECRYVGSFDPGEDAELECPGCLQQKK